MEPPARGLGVMLAFYFKYLSLLGLPVCWR